MLHRPHRCVHPVGSSRTLTRPWRGAAPLVLIGALAACLAASQAAASPPSISAKRAEAAQVLSEINGLNANLDKADELVNLANLRLKTVQRDIVENRHALSVAKHNLARSRKTIAKRLVTLYTSPQSSTLELILGAKSLDDILNQLDNANRVSSLDSQVIGQVVTLRASVRRHAVALTHEQRQVANLIAQRRQQQRAIEVRVGEKRNLLSSLNAQVAQLVHDQQVAQMLSAQRARQIAAQADSNTATIGASADTPEGATIVPPSNYGGVVGIALGYQGVPYVWGGASPGGFDCSGLVMYSYAQVGVSLPHSSYAMWNYGVAVPKDELEPGDIVFFDGLGHVGIYIGGGLFVDAPHTGTVVQVASLDSGWYAETYVGARRIL
ncbi:MAG TPA: NlpC/P60 family protein [Gaiellaceae bacterium]